MQQHRQRHRVNQQPVAVLSLFAVAGTLWHNWRLWQSDRRRVDLLRAQSRPVPALPAYPRVSVLVAAWNEAHQIDAHLRSFDALVYPNIELIVCAGGEDDTLQRAMRYERANIRVLEQQPGEGKQAALARCYQHATGHILYFTDADCRYDDAALAWLLAPLIAEDEQVATGCSRPLIEQGHKTLPCYLWSADVVANVARPTYTTGLLGRNMAVTRNALEASGGLSFLARTGTDYQLAKRLLGAGYRIRFVRESEVQTQYPESALAYRRKQGRWLRNLLLHGWHYGAMKDVAVTLRTVLVGLTMVVAPLASMWFGIGTLSVWMVLLIHAASSKLRYILFTARLYHLPVAARLVWSILPLTLLDFAIWAVPALDLLFPRRREQW